MITNVSAWDLSVDFASDVLSDADICCTAVKKYWFGVTLGDTVFRGLHKSVIGQLWLFCVSADTKSPRKTYDHLSASTLPELSPSGSYRSKAIAHVD